MKRIIKSASPEELETYKQTPGARYEDMDSTTKKAIRKSLVEEQGYLCCYCGMKIENDYHSTIDHIKPQGVKEYEDLQLDYNNLICSCDGDEQKRCNKTKAEKKKFPSHCNNIKADQKIKVSPLDIDCESKFEFDEEGNIDGVDQDAKETIKVLGLDCSTLNTDRKAAIQPYIDKYRGKTVSKDVLEAKIAELEQKNNEGRFIPFCFVSIYYIKNYLLPLAK